jgi:transaldolase
VDGILGAGTRVAVQDIQLACDQLAHVHAASKGADGFVSIEVSPHLAHDAAATLEQARHLWRAVHRPNAMIKVPATDAGLEAIETLTAEGINVNVTLLFSVARYEQVFHAWVRGLARCANPRDVASVASFFVSRVDGVVDPELQAIGGEATRHLHRAAIANAKMAYQAFERLRREPAFAEQERRGARVQRPLWASTSTKDPNLSDTLYVDHLIGADTVNTVPPKTLDAVVEHGTATITIDEDLEQARATLAALERHGIDMDAIARHLEADGVQKFIDSHDALVTALHDKLAEVTSRYAAEG